MRIFISYSHNNADQPLARYLAGRLRAVGIDVWQDESSQPAGEQLQEDIEKAIRESDHAIFIVSKIWLESRWCKVEVDRFDKRDRTKVRRIPIFRRSPERLRLPAPLIDLKGITWLPGEPHRDAKFWEVICAVQGRDPGPADQWAAEGAKLTHDAGDFDDTAKESKDFGSLRCDRAPQWTSVTDAEPDDSHDLLIVPGAVGQAHEHFCRRIRETLPPPPSREIVTVSWQQRPAGRAEFLAALARSLGVLPAALVREMAERMDDSNLILIHPCLRAKFVDDTLISYYTEWLPALLQDVKPTRHLKCVQPVEWPQEESAVATALTWLRFKPSPQAEGKPEAETFIGRVRQDIPAAIRCMRLRDLADITDEDLDDFCEKEKLAGTKKAWLIAQINARKPRNSEEKLAAIDAFLPDARSL